MKENPIVSRVRQGFIMTACNLEKPLTEFFARKYSIKKIPFEPNQGYQEIILSFPLWKILPDLLGPKDERNKLFVGKTAFEVVCDHLSTHENISKVQDAKVTRVIVIPDIDLLGEHESCFVVYLETKI